MQAGFSPMAPFPPQNGGHALPNPQAVHNGQYQQSGPIGHQGLNMPNGPTGSNGNPSYNGHNNIPPQPLHYRNPKVLEIFGSLLGGPVLTQLLNFNPDMSEEQLENVKHILETFPVARDDMAIFGQILNQRQQGQQGEVPVTQSQPQPLQYAPNGQRL
jgi:hypothetical protein